MPVVPVPVAMMVMSMMIVAVRRVDADADGRRGVVVRIRPVGRGYRDAPCKPHDCSHRGDQAFHPSLLVTVIVPI
jgi:hypothetical protein